jgi:ferrous iron transport protein B
MVSGSHEVASVIGLSSAAALAYLIFNLFTPPCFAAIGAMNAEMESKKWLWGGIAFQFGTGYTLSFITYQAGTFMTKGTVGSGFLYGLAAVVAMILYVGYLVRKGENKDKRVWYTHKAGEKYV